MNIYIHSTGVPRGVPDELKVRNQIAAEFESLFWWVTANFFDCSSRSPATTEGYCTDGTGGGGNCGNGV